MRRLNYRSYFLAVTHENGPFPCHVSAAIAGEERAWGGVGHLVQGSPDENAAGGDALLGLGDPQRCHRVRKEVTLQEHRHVAARGLLKGRHGGRQVGRARHTQRELEGRKGAVVLQRGARHTSGARDG